ncbi:hypothetical protein C8R44DRAFT_757669 [Mycena epipterygia]|nr:hypothetical protein C8R44DRAFT_757669 [Mycena epipterygia]
MKLLESNMDHKPCSHCVLASVAETDGFRLTPLPIHLLSSYDVLSESEEAEIHRTILQGRARLSYLESEINSLHKVMDKLLKDRDEVRDHVEQHLAVLSPMRRFPPEILCQIFWWTLPSDNSRTPDFRTEGPWNISQVCTRWRAISIAFPAIWTQIGIADQNFPVGALETQLERSHPHPLDIDISFERSMNAFPLLLDSSTRWISLNAVLTAGMVSIFNEVEGRFPRLRRLEYMDYCNVRCTAFETAPMLTDVAIYGDPSFVSLPFAQLTRLRLQIPESPDHLRLAQNLVHLTLESEMQSPIHPDPIELPRLRQMFLQDGRYLQSLVLPALEDIYIWNWGGTLPRFIDQSSCRLKKLTLITDVPDIISILDRAPTLLEIRLRRFSKINDLLARLTIPPGDSSPGAHTACPQLRRLSLCDTKPGYFEEELPVALQMLESRVHSSVCSPISLTVLSPAANSTSSALHSPTSQPDLKSHIEWVVGARARKRLRSWRENYPGRQMY